MKIKAITTIGQHSKGVDLHLRNLRWALGEGSEIIVQHFAFHNMPLMEDVRFIPADSDPSQFYFFWDNASSFLYDDSDFFLFTEQDIFATCKIKDTIELLGINDSSKIKISFSSDYLSIFNNNNEKIYPRIWEGFTLVPGWMVRKAIDENVNFGNHVRASLNWELGNLRTHYNGWMYVFDYINKLGKKMHEGDFDTMFEFSLFCFLQNFSYVGHYPNSGCNYDVSRDAVHFRGIDRLCFDCKEIYNNLESLYELLKVPEKELIYEKMINDGAIMLLLSKVHPPSSLMKRLLNNRLNKCNLNYKLSQLNVCASKWMDEQELEYLQWAIGSIKGLKIC